MIIKILLPFVALFSTSASLISNSIESSSRKSFNELAEMQINKIEEDLILNSKTTGSETIYNYQGQQYRDENSIISQELLKNPILQQKTSSNPNKIIKNYSTNELDPNKIYSTNSGDFVKVYKNALGKAVLPSCLPGQSEGCYSEPIGEIKSAKDRALDSYVNKGLIRPKFSYDSIDWFDSQNEAETAYKNSNFEVKQSLFYVSNGQYYNAFNKGDKDKLLAKMKAGYYYDAFQTKKDDNGLIFETVDNDLSQKMGGNPLGKSFRFEENYFNEFFKANFSKYFMDNINDIISSNLEYSITLKAPNGQWFNVIENGFKDIVFETSENNRKLKIKVSNKGRENIELIGFLNKINSRGDWKPYIKKSKPNQCLVENDLKRTHDFKFLGLEGEKFSFRLDTNEEGCAKRGFPDTNPEKIEITKSYSSGDSGGYSLQILNEFFIEKLNKVFGFKNKFKNKKIISEFLHANSLLLTDLIEQISHKINSNNLSDNLKNLIFENNFELLKPNLYNTEISNTPIFKDWMYGSTLDSNKTAYQFSFHESQLNFQSNILKNKLTEVTSENKNITLNLGDAEFTTTFKNWKDNFYYLDNDKNDNGYKLVRKFYVDNNEEKDITEFSDIYSENIANTYEAAMNKKMENETKILRKAYEVYDINGRLFFSRKSESETIKELRKQIELNFKYINKSEAKKLRDQDTNWLDIVSDGNYTIYKFKLNTGKWVYYKDYQSALEIYRNQSSLINSITEEFIVYKIYSTFINGELKNYEWDNKTNTRILAEKIYNENRLKGE